METNGTEKITCIIGSKDSGIDIKECIESARFLGEVIVIDDFSTDKTQEIARKYADKLIEKKMGGYPEQMDFAIKQASNRWVLILDADERIAPQLQKEIKDKFARPPGVSGYMLRRLNIFLGREILHCGWYEHNNLKLFDREKVSFDLSMKYLGRWNVAGDLGTLENNIVHYTCRDLYSYFKRMNLWSSMNTEDLIDKGYRITLLNTPYYFFLKPAAVFLMKYVGKLGFLDGFEGFLICVLSACTYFLSYAKLSRRQGMSIRRLYWRNPWRNDPVLPGRKRFVEGRF